MIPLFKPDMPSSEELLPYLRQMDQDKWYANFGPRLRTFEKRLARHFKVSQEQIVTVTSATAGLTVALKSILSQYQNSQYQNSRTEFTCLIPAWTFVATAQAVLEAGGKPVFCDVAPKTGAMTPSLVDDYLMNNPKPDVVLPVAPFGASVSVAEWDHFSDRHDLPVVVDAAASFCALSAGKCPAVVSLHATKVFGIGEGGVIITSDAELAENMRKSTTFGFSAGRVAMGRGGNYKLSEYHASVGLAQFDRLESLVSRLKKKRLTLIAMLEDIKGITLLSGEETKVSSTLNVIVEKDTAVEVVKILNNNGIGAGLWWEDVLYQNPVFDFESGSLHNNFPTAESLYKSVVALPFSSSLSGVDMSKIVMSLRQMYDGDR